ncbi:MAG: hypothetical protein ABI852_22080, partial [Gemmatimonadaceae bacterium]
MDSVLAAKARAKARRDEAKKLAKASKGVSTGKKGKSAKSAKPPKKPVSIDTAAKAEVRAEVIER